MSTLAMLEEGRTALNEGRWEDAVATFSTCLDERETAAALEGMGEALWWLCRAADSVRYRERAYVSYRREGEAVRASRTAIDLSIGYLVNLGNEAAARGWLARAAAVVQALDPNPMQGWLWLMQGYLDGDVDRLGQALEWARQAEDADLELMALADLGIALVQQERTEEGMALLDEAMAGTTGGEHRRLDTVVFVTCNMLAACSLVGDLVRADQWCRVADEFLRRHSSPFLYARCRVHYGSLLVAKGRWDHGESQLRAALDMSEDAGPGPRAKALAHLAELRVRQGRLEEAEALLAHFENPADAALPLAALRLAQGEPETAAALLSHRLEQLGADHPGAPETIARLVEAHLAAGELKAAEAACVLLQQGADANSLTAALAALSLARLACAEGDTDAASGGYEQALDLLAPLDLPLQTAQARSEFAAALAAHHPEVAAEEARAAFNVLDRLGAVTAADAAAALLRSLGVTGRIPTRETAALTRREQEVLALVGVGLSNPEIGQRLFISRKTVSHHVSRVLTKLGLRNRAEAAAYAARQSRDVAEGAAPLP